jgi:hypothetical protein
VFAALTGSVIGMMSAAEISTVKSTEVRRRNPEYFFIKYVNTKYRSQSAAPPALRVCIYPFNSYFQT